MIDNTWESLSPATILGMNLLTLRVWAPWAFSVFCRRRGSSSRTWHTNWSNVIQMSIVHACVKDHKSTRNSTNSVPCHSCEKNVGWAFQKAAGGWQWRPSTCTRQCWPSPSRSPACLPTWDVMIWSISCLLSQISIFTCRLCWLGRCSGKAWNRMQVGLSGTQWCLTHSGIPDASNVTILNGKTKGECKIEETNNDGEERGPWSLMIASMAPAGRQSCPYLRTLYSQQGRQGSWWCSDEGKCWLKHQE